MQRPIMNPMFLEPDSNPNEPSAPRRRRFRPLTLFARFMLADLCLWRSSRRLKIEDGSPIQRLLRSLLYRLLFVPVVMAMVVVAMVYVGTHPPRIRSVLDPLSQGMYYDPVSFAAADGARLEGWLIPLLDAKTVMERKERILREKHPAVILVHDYGTSRVQMLPLVQPLHDAGYLVLVVGLRGTNDLTSHGSAFGLREHADVAAAAEMLRRRPGVDPDHIAVLGIGTGANAALLAATRDPRLAALILDHPVANVDQMISDRLGPPQPWLQFLRPLCKWTFELAYRIDAEDLDLQRSKDTLASRPVLMFDAAAVPAQSFRQTGIKDIRDFLAKHLPPMKDKPTVHVDVEELN